MRLHPKTTWRGYACFSREVPPSRFAKAPQRDRLSIGRSYCSRCSTVSEVRSALTAEAHGGACPPTKGVCPWLRLPLATPAASAGYYAMSRPWRRTTKSDHSSAPDVGQSCGWSRNLPQIRLRRRIIASGSKRTKFPLRAVAAGLLHQNSVSLLGIPPQRVAENCQSF